jgi:hypothetical protein
MVTTAAATRPRRSLRAHTSPPPFLASVLASSLGVAAEAGQTDEGSASVLRHWRWSALVSPRLAVKGKLARGHGQQGRDYGQAPAYAQSEIAHRMHFVSRRQQAPRMCPVFRYAFGQHRERTFTEAPGQ